jgi:hypothetical protein
MSKQAISVTLASDNITWLRGRVGASGLRSVSELLDRLVTDARQKGDHTPSRSVVGTIDLDPTDPTLERADAVVRTAFARSLAQPAMVRERAPQYAAARTRSKRRRG